MTFDLGRRAKLAFTALASVSMLAACGGNDNAVPAAEGQGGNLPNSGVQAASALVFHKVSKDTSISKDMANYTRVVDCRSGAVGIHYSSSTPLVSGSPAYFTPEGIATLASFCKANGRDPGFVEPTAAIEAKVLSGPRVVMNKIVTPSGYADYYTGIDCDTGMTWINSASVSISSALPVGTTAAALDSLAQACRSQGSTPGFVPTAIAPQ